MLSGIICVRKVHPDLGVARMIFHRWCAGLTRAAETRRHKILILFTYFRRALFRIPRNQGSVRLLATTAVARSKATARACLAQSGRL